MDIYPTLKRSQIFVAFMKNIQFFDFNTEFLLIQMNGYNLNKNIWITVKLIFEQTPNGLVHTKYELCTLNIFTEMAAFMDFKLSLESIVTIIVTLVLVFYTFSAGWSITKRLIKDHIGYLMDIWNIFYIFQVSMYAITIFIRVYIYLTIFGLIGIQNSDKFIDTDNVCALYQNLLVLETLSACVTLIYFLNYLDKNMIQPISSAVQESLRSIIVFLVSFVMCILGFSMFCMFIYGTRSLGNCFSLNIFLKFKFEYLKY
jgi:hypothetical protein